MKSAEERKAARKEAGQAVANMYAKRLKEGALDADQKAHMQAQEEMLAELIGLRLEDARLRGELDAVITLKASAARRAYRLGLSGPRIAAALGLKSRQSISDYLYGVTRPEPQQENESNDRI